jgi:hypothetical protein
MFVVPGTLGGCYCYGGYDPLVAGRLWTRPEVRYLVVEYLDRVYEFR